MSALRTKLCSRRGETLAEALISVLILGLSTLMLAGLMATAGQIGAQAQKRDQEFFEALDKAEARSDPLPRGYVQIREGDIDKDRIEVECYGSERLKAFALPAPAGGGAGG